MIAELGEGLGGERRPNAAGAVDDDRRRLVGDPVLDLRFEVAARNVDRTGQRTFLVLVGLTHVEHDRPVGDVGGGALGVDLTDLGLRGGEQVSERCHDEKAYRVSRDYDTVLTATVPV